MNLQIISQFLTKIVEKIVIRVLTSEKVTKVDVQNVISFVFKLNRELRISYLREVFDLRNCFSYEFKIVLDLQDKIMMITDTSKPS